jgi:hypothetical protein
MSDGMVELRDDVDRGNPQRKCSEHYFTVTETRYQCFIIFRLMKSTQMVQIPPVAVTVCIKLAICIYCVGLGLGLSTS